MTAAFVTHYLLAIGVVGALLCAVRPALRRLSSHAATTPGTARLVAVIGSAGLAQSATLHVVRIGQRYYALAVSPRGTGPLLALPRELEGWIGENRSPAARSTGTARSCSPQTP